MMPPDRVGNILVRLVDPSGRVAEPHHQTKPGILGDGVPSLTKGILERIINDRSGVMDPPALSAGHSGPLRTQLVLLDFGLAEELTPRVRHHFISFLNAICSGRCGMNSTGGTQS